MKPLLIACLFLCFAMPAQAAEIETPSADGRMVLMAPVETNLGMPFLIRLTSLDPLGEVTVYWLGREVLPAVSVWNDKHIILAMLGTDVKTTAPGPCELVVVAKLDKGPQNFTRIITVRNKVYPEEPDRNIVSKSVPQGVRLEREAKEASKAVNSNTPLRCWFLPFDKPVDAPISGSYGVECNVGGRQTFRRGVDFALEPGTKVKACGTGTVVLVADHLQAGKSVYLDHGNGVVSIYFHLLRADVTLGQTLARAEVIGLSGSSGVAQTPKLHFAIAVQGRLVDPEPLFDNNAQGLLPQ